MTFGDDESVLRERYDDLRWQYYLDEFEQYNDLAHVYLTNEAGLTKFDVFDYFPHAHYQMAIDDIEQRLLEYSEGKSNAGAAERIAPDAEDEFYLLYNPDAQSIIQHNGRPVPCDGGFPTLKEAGEAILKFKEFYEVPDGELDFDLYVVEPVQRRH